MKAVRFIVPALLLALSATVYAGDQDVNALMAKLAAQEARLAAQDARMAAQEARINDLNAKFANNTPKEGDAPEGIMSIQKNARVTVGGVVSTRYQFSRAKIDSGYDLADPSTTRPVYGRAVDHKTGSLFLNDAELAVQVDVNDHFDAFLNIDLYGDGGEVYGNAMTYYVRWKNICETGFGIKVGRDALVFGEDGVGELGSYAAGSGEGLGELGHGWVIPPHNGWDMDGVTQVTPYYEGWDGKLNLELSFMQNVWNNGPRGEDAVIESEAGRIRSRNYGLGTMSFRAVIEPVEGLWLSGSIVNFRSNGFGADDPGYSHAKNNTATSLAFSYRPVCFDRVNVWGQWVHGWNVDNIDSLDSDAFNFGLSFDLTDALTVFAQGDYLRTGMDTNGVRFRGKALAWYGGVMYNFGNGAALEAGWKHERTDHHYSGATATGKAKGVANTVYAHLGFEF